MGLELVRSAVKQLADDDSGVGAAEASSPLSTAAKRKNALRAYARRYTDTVLGLVEQELEANPTIDSLRLIREVRVCNRSK